jgi:hypothetical protein
MRIRMLFVLLLIAPALLAQVPTGVPESGCCAPRPPGLTAWWPFDPAGAPSHDRIPPDNVGTHFGGPAAQPGVVNQALCFNGNGAYVEAADHPDLDFANACSNSEPIFIDFWIRTTQSGVVTILDKRERSPRAKGWAVYLDGGRPGIQLATGTGSSDNCSGPLNTSVSCTNETAPPSAAIANGAWHFVAIRVTPRCNPNPRGSIFVDGNLVHTFVPRQGDLANAAPLSIGRRPPAFGQMFFNGCLDELEIGKRPLTDAQIFAIFNAGRRGKC